MNTSHEGRRNCAVPESVDHPFHLCEHNQRCKPGRQPDAFAAIGGTTGFKHAIGNATRCCDLWSRRPELSGVEPSSPAHGRIQKASMRPGRSVPSVQPYAPRPRSPTGSRVHWATPLSALPPSTTRHFGLFFFFQRALITVALFVFVCDCEATHRLRTLAGRLHVEDAVRERPVTACHRACIHSIRSSRWCESLLEAGHFHDHD